MGKMKKNKACGPDCLPIEVAKALGDEGAIWMTGVLNEAMRKGIPEECIEKNWLKVSRAKTEHLQTTGDTDPVRMKRYMETEMVNLPTVQSFKYIGPTIDRGGGASKDVDNRVTKAWSKWRELSGVICDKKIPKN